MNKKTLMLMAALVATLGATAQRGSVVVTGDVAVNQMVERHVELNTKM